MFHMSFDDLEMSFDDLEIIKIVQANPCLYVKDSKTYKNIDKKHCWEQIGAALTTPKTGEAVQKRWESLRTMFVRAHRKRLEYIPSGSGANNCPDENDGIDFIYYAEMSFLISHYKPRRTRSNFKVKETSKEMPSPTAVGGSINIPINSTWNVDLESITDTDRCFTPLSVATTSPLSSPLNQSLSPTSSISNNESVQINSVQFVPFSPSAIKAIKNHTESNSSSKDSTTNKFKSNKRDIEVVPVSDNFAKRKKGAMDNFIGETSKMMNKMASTVDTIISNRQTQALSNDENVFLSATIAYTIQDVPKENKTKCLIKILQVVEEFMKK